MRTATRLAVALCGLVLVVGVPAAAPAADTDRLPEVARALKRVGYLIDKPYGGGDTDKWVDRIRAAAMDVRHPVYVVLPYAVRGDGLPDDGATLVRALRRAGVGRGYYVVGNDLTSSVYASGVPVAPVRAADADLNRVLDGLADPTRVLTTAWFRIRLLSDDDPPTPAALISEAEAHESYFPVEGAYPKYEPVDDPVITPWSGATIGIVVLVCLAILGLVLRGSARRRSAGAAVSPVEVFTVSDLTDPYALQVRMTELSNAIAQRPPSEESAYVHATRNAEAAARYAEAERPRDRLGASLLAMAGLDALAQRTAHRPCVFNPLHEADRVLSRTVEGVRLERAPCCAACLGAVRNGAEPATLQVPTTDGGAPEPYDAVDDVWTRTAYGALSENLAEQAISASFEERR